MPNLHTASCVYLYLVVELLEANLGACRKSFLEFYWNVISGKRRELVPNKRNNNGSDMDSETSESDEDDEEDGSGFEPLLCSCARCFMKGALTTYVICNKTLIFVLLVLILDRGSGVGLQLHLNALVESNTEAIHGGSSV